MKTKAIRLLSNYDLIFNFSRIDTVLTGAAQQRRRFFPFQLSFISYQLFICKLLVIQQPLDSHLKHH